MADEVELKFDVDPASVARLRASPVLAEVNPSRARSETLYYDTADGALRAAGISLRVRRSAGRYVQTLKRKRGAVAGLFVRDEWELEVPSLALDIDAFRGTPAWRFLAHVRDVPLAVVIGTRFARTTWRLAFGRSDIEVVLDEGTVRAGARSAPLIELELELKRGRAADLFALAESIDEAAPLRLGLMSKNERGYALAAGELGRPAKAEPVELDETMSEGAAFRVIALSCLRQFRRNEIALLGGRDSGALHQARVALRRLRSALTLFRHALRGKPYREQRESLRWLACQLGEARNLDVLTGEGAPAPFAGDPVLRAAALAARERAYDRVIDALEAPRTRAILLRLALWLELGVWRERRDAQALLGDSAPARLDRLWERVRRRGIALGELDAAGEHRLRLDVKKLRYAAGFLAGLSKGRGKARPRRLFVDALKELQEDLGVANDARIANEVAARLAPGLPPAPVPETPIRRAGHAFRRAAAVAGYWHKQGRRDA